MSTSMPSTQELRRYRQPTRHNRHSFAVTCVKHGVSTASLKKILGHDRLETTEIYLNICPEDALSEFAEKVAGGKRRRWGFSSQADG